MNARDSPLPATRALALLLASLLLLCAAGIVRRAIACGKRREARGAGIAGARRPRRSPPPTPRAGSRARAESAAPAPARDPVPVALVLPLESPTYGRAADAVKAGFTAAAAAARRPVTT